MASGKHLVQEDGTYSVAYYQNVSKSLIWYIVRHGKLNNLLTSWNGWFDKTIDKPRQTVYPKYSKRLT